MFGRIATAVLALTASLLADATDDQTLGCAQP